MILRDIRRTSSVDKNSAMDERVVCIIDDNKNKWNRDVDGVPVVGGRDSIIENVKERKHIPISLAIQQTERGNQNYSSFKTRQAESMLWIVTKPDLVDEMKSLVEEVSSQHQQTIKIQVTSEKDLV